MDDRWGGASWPGEANTGMIGSPMQHGKEKFHLSLFIHALVGALIASLIGRGIYAAAYNQGGSNVFLVGSILALIAGGTLLGCVVCERITPRITVRKELGIVEIILGMLVTLAVFVAGCVGEFLYELNSAYTPVVFNDYLFAIDDSGSMETTDPNDLRYSALSKLLDSLNSDKRAGLVRFMDSVYCEPIELQYMDDEQKEKLHNGIAEHVSTGGTDIYAALKASLELCQDAKESGRAPVVVLLSDGGSYVPVSKVAKQYINEEVAISTVSLGPGSDNALLQQLAQATGGEYFKVEKAEDLVAAFQKVSTAKTYRCLFAQRPGVQRKNVLYMLLRVLFLLLPGVLIGTFISLLFREFDVRRQMLVSVLAGFIAGLIMEIGTFLLLPLWLVHLVSWVLYGTVLLHYEETKGIVKDSFGDPNFGKNKGNQWEDRQGGDIQWKQDEEGGRIDQGDYHWKR